MKKKEATGAVSYVMLFTMAAGALQLREDWEDYSRMSGYVSELKKENAELTKTYRAGYDLEEIRKAKEEEISAIDGIGPAIAKSIAEYFREPEHERMLDHLLTHLEIEQVVVGDVQIFAGTNFVITGSTLLNHLDMTNWANSNLIFINFFESFAFKRFENCFSIFVRFVEFFKLTIT